MPVHFAALLGDLSFFLFQLLRLLSQPGRRGRDLLGLGVDLRLPPIELVFTAHQGLLHLADLALPFDQLLAEGGDGEAVLVAGRVQGLFLLAGAPPLGLHRPPPPFPVLGPPAALAVDYAVALPHLLSAP